jgi:hypothetical protein
MMRVDDDVSGWLRGAIREAAGQYEPDRARMHARVRAAMPVRRRRGRLRAAGVSLAMAVGVAAITTAGWQVYASRGPNARAERLAGGSSPTPSAPRMAAVSSGAASPTATAESPMPARREASSVVSRATGAGHFLTCTGAVDPAGDDLLTRETVTVSTKRRLSSLRVTFRVASTKGIASAGSFLNLPSDDFRITVQERGGVLSYQFVLKAGRTVPRGDWTFTVQYNHADGVGLDRDPDTYVVAATATGDDDVRIRGHF